MTESDTQAVELIHYAAGLKKQFTATGYVINPSRTRLLMIFHRGLGRWLPPGGHVDPDELPGDTVLREVWEETGVRASHVGAHPLDLGLNGATETQLPTPFATAAQLIPASPKDIEHIHVDLMYQLIADDTGSLLGSESEVDAVRWFTRAEILGGDGSPDSARAFATRHLVKDMQ